jgi:hypothetical protein
MFDSDLFWTIVSLILTISPALIYWYAWYQAKEK